jgi:hypothetical protein
MYYTADSLEPMLKCIALINSSIVKAAPVKQAITLMAIQTQKDEYSVHLVLVRFPEFDKGREAAVPVIFDSIEHVLNYFALIHPELLKLIRQCYFAFKLQVRGCPESREPLVPDSEFYADPEWFRDLPWLYSKEEEE